MNTSTKQTNAARDAGQKTQITVRDRTGNIISPGDPDYDMMKAKQESRERRAAAHIGLLATPAHTPAHTPEPWHHSADLPHHGCRLIHAADGYLVADAGRITKRTGDEMDSNAARIVQCVNAYEGMTDPAVEIAALRAAQDEALGLRIALVDAQKRIASLRAERTAYQTAARAWKDEVTALRAALEPFAELATSAKCDEMPEHAACTFVITAASMLAALAALAGKGDK